jgi:hypothetical protein
LYLSGNALDKPWVLDIDASIKPLYGRQEGAEPGYLAGALTYVVHYRLMY